MDFDISSLQSPGVFASGPMPAPNQPAASDAAMTPAVAPPSMAPAPETGINPQVPPAPPAGGTPVGTPNPPPHARLLAMVSALALGLSNAGKSIATHGREGGVSFFATSTSGDVLAHFINGTTTTFTEVVTSVAPASGAVGTPTDIVGSGFGTAQGASTVTFNGVLVTTIISWSDTLIVVMIPTGATRGDVVVTVNGEASPGVPFTVTASTQQPFVSYVNTNTYQRTRIITTTGSDENK